MSDKYPGGFVTANAPAGFSVAFDGSGDSLSVPSNAAWQFDSGNFTVEAWVYFNSVGNAQFLTCPVVGGLYWQYYAGVMDFGNNAGGSVQASWTPVAGTWYHVAAVRNGATLTHYINGAVLGSGSAFNVTATTTLGIGAGGAGSFNGYFSNLRIVKGTAVYTTTFTPPTQLFPVSGTSLLTCQSPTIIDNSTNAFTITAAGDAKVSNFTPFAGYTGFNPALGAAAGGVWTLDEAAYYQNNRQWPIYDPYFKNTTLMLHGNGTNGAQNNTFLDSSTNNFTITRNGNTTQGTFTPFSQTGWSNYFSTSPFLTVASNTAFDFGSGDATQEMWIYPTTASQTGGLFDKRSIGANYSQFPQITIESGVLKVYVSYTGSSWAVQITGATPTPNAWTHIALVRYGNTWTLYVNGVVSGTPVVASGSVYASTNNLCIGASATDGSNPYTGYISNVRIVKGTALYTSNFTPSTAPLTAVTGTSLLTCQSNRFVDNSANNFSITLNSTVSVQAFSPFVPAYITPTTYSNWFDGTGDYLTVPDNANLELGSGDFTIECWINTTVSNGGYVSAVSKWGSSNQSYMIRAASTDIGSGWSFFYSTNGTNYFTVFGSSINDGGWHHVAVTRSGNVFTTFTDGVLKNSTTDAVTLYNGTSSVTIGAGDAGANPFTGLISNLRIVKGTALYTASFTPPTAPLTAVTNTQLLTCQSSTFIDNSANAFTITATGNVQPVTSPTPFPAKVDTTTLNSAYSTSLIGGSAYFDGTGDYLTVPNNAAFKFGTGDFTVDGWFYFSGLVGTYSTLFTIGDYTNGILMRYQNAGGANDSLYIGGTNYNWAPATNLRLNSWNHVALVKNGTGSNNVQVYINGVSILTITSSYDLQPTGSVYIGTTAHSLGDVWNGYISNFRLVKGTALYTSPFTPPTAPTTAVTNTQLLLNYTNGAIFDNTAKNVLETVGTAQISTTQSKYGGSSIKTDGSTSSWVYIPFNRNLDLSTGAPDWTLECWGYVVSFANSPYFFNKGGVAASTYTNYGFNMNTSGVVYCTLGNNSGETSYSFGTCAINTWYHFAATRQGSTIRTFLNGVLVTSQSIATTMTDNGEGLYIGCLKNLTSNVLNGYVDDLRITKGVARYVTNFTPPTSQLQDQ